MKSVFKTSSASKTAEEGGGGVRGWDEPTE